jgi:hypothetical protein
LPSALTLLLTNRSEQLRFWFANGSPAGTFVTPAGDFSTLSQNTGTHVYTRTMPDGTKYTFDASGKQRQ